MEPKKSHLTSQRCQYLEQFFSFVFVTPYSFCCYFHFRFVASQLILCGGLLILCDTAEWRSGSDTAGSISLGDGSGTARQYEILPVDVTTACDEDVGSAGEILSVQLHL